MFGLTEMEMYNYHRTTVTHIIETVIPTVINGSTFITKLNKETNKPDTTQIVDTVSNVNSSLMVAFIPLAYEYAHLQSELSLTEEEIIEKLHAKYESILMDTFIDFSIAFSEDILNEAVVYMLAELPMLYGASLDDEDKGEDFMDEREDAYEKYISAYLSVTEEEEDDSLFDEDEEETDE